MAARLEVALSLTSRKGEKFQIRVVDRLLPDDVFAHLVRREMFRLAGGNDPGTELHPEYIDYLVRERYSRI